jgi:2-keto-4-pentenoate hydratase
MSTLATISSVLLGTSSDTLAADVTAAEQYASIAYVVIAVELAILIIIGISIARKMH